MILHRLALRHFKSYRAADIEFPAEGLIGIVGANGAGKSTLFEALLFALYGKMPFDKNLLRTAGATTKNAVAVEAEFSVRGKRYLVRRELRGKALTHKAKLTDENERVLAEQDRPVGEEVARLLGLDETAFVRSVFARQKELAVLSSDQGEVRKANVRRMLGLDRIDDAFKAANADLNDAKKILEGMQSTLLDEEKRELLASEIAAEQESERAQKKKIDKAEAAAETARKAYQQVEKARGALQERKDERAKIEKENTGKQASLAETEKAVVSLRDELAKLGEMSKESEQLAADEKAYQAAVKKKDMLIAARERFNERQKLAANRTEREEDLAQAKEDLESRRIDRDQIGDVATPVKQAQAASEQATETFKRAKICERETTKAISAIEERIGDRERKRSLIADLGEKADCPTCERPLEGEYDSILQKMANELNTLQQKELKRLQQAHTKTADKLQAAEAAKHKADEALTQAKQKAQQAAIAERELTKAQPKMADAQAACQAANKALIDFGEALFDPQALKAVQAKVDELKPKHERYAVLTTKLERRPQVERDLADKEILGKQLAETIGLLTEKLAALPFDENELRQASEASARTAQAMSDAVKIVGDYKSERQKIRAAIEGRQKQLEHDDQQRRTIADRLERQEDLAACVEALRSFRTAALAHVTPEIDRLASALFARVTRGRYPRIHVTDDFEFVITDDGAAYPIKRFSGGEIDLANLCLRVAVGRVVAHLHGQSAPGLLAFDEIFGSQDDDRRAQLIEALLHLEGQVLVISHQDAIKDDFQHALLVRRADDGSTAAWI